MLPVIARGNSECPLERETVAVRPTREGRNEGGSHESLEEVDLLGPGKPGGP